MLGIDTIVWDLKEKKMMVTGDVDPVTLVGKLRKVCHTEICTVGPGKEPAEKKEEPDKEIKKNTTKDEHMMYDKYLIRGPNSRATLLFILFLALPIDCEQS
ncbi:hypothetical protein LguiA_026944 [Lonicera macranthoides]